MNDTQPKPADLDRNAQIRHVVDAALQGRNRGEEVSDDTLCQEHPNLLPELAVELRKLRVIARAREQSQPQAPDQNNAAIDETTAFVPTQRHAPRLSRSLRIR